MNNHASHAGAYRSAMSAAMDELNSIHQEAIRVRNRMEQLDSLLEALKPFTRSVEGTTVVEDHGVMRKSLESSPEPLQANRSVPQTMAETAIPAVAHVEVIESADPIQRRINSAFGLAVA